MVIPDQLAFIFAFVDVVCTPMKCLADDAAGCVVLCWIGVWSYSVATGVVQIRSEQSGSSFSPTFVYCLSFVVNIEPPPEHVDAAPAVDEFRHSHKIVWYCIDSKSAPAFHWQLFKAEC